MCFMDLNLIAKSFFVLVFLSIWGPHLTMLRFIPGSTQRSPVAELEVHIGCQRKNMGLLHAGKAYLSCLIFELNFVSSKR